MTLTNNMNPEDRLSGLLGFGVPGIEIYLPISSQFLIGCLCPSIRAMFRGLTRLGDSLLQRRERANLRKAFEGTTTLELNPENM